MGCKAEGAAQGYVVLGGIVLFLHALFMLLGGFTAAIGGDINALIEIVIAIALIIMVVLAFDASGFIHWKITRSGVLLAIIGFVSIIIVVRGISFDLILWLTNIGTLAGLMILLAGLLLIFRK